ncbi:nucleolar complex-associated protein-domain-containing protein [Zychaea mexicana]|uniref:nucleolar complex-associated protein-domain-containing protein n=1 Tax=Zychaea mexicana TaxID=64656 RepID=UPI0022FEC741|nr:nucleolar complex-associated protein-domain-containing protein [Zychaea mexicana]KAI9492352.1 nucleolar complex-associated protein-domain-containing protein [Zychaea mexicana]
MGSAKKNTKKTTKPPNNKAASAAKAATAKSGKKKNSTTKSKDPLDNLPDYVAVPEAEDKNVEISEEDLAFFAENQDWKFLKSMDSKAITKNEMKKKAVEDKKKAKKRAQTTIPDPATAELTSSDEDDYNDDDLEDFDEDDLPSINGSSVNGEELDLASVGENEVASSDEDDDMDDDLLDDNFDDISDDDDDLDDLDEEEEDQQRPAKKKRKQQTESDEEMDYELKPRKVAGEWMKKDYHNRLPVKLPGGKIAQVQPDFSEEEKSDREEGQVEEEKEEEVDEAEELVPEEPARKLTKKEYLLAKKEELAQAASTIQEDPESNAGMLKTLKNIAKDDNPTVKKLALLTQLAVYKDIIPGYRIRPLTEKEEAVKVSKEVKKLREFEKTLLSNYESYLKDLDSLLKAQKGREEDVSLSLVATRCLCELLTTKTHFNFRLNIMVTIVSRMSTVNWNEIANMCCKAIINVFENDESGRTSLDAVTMITRMIKSKNYSVHENVINSFLHLRLKDELAPPSAQSDKDDDQRGKKRKKQFLNKKARKALKETKEIEKEFKEAEAVVSKEEKEKNHTETLKQMFAFYFRILKKQSMSPLLPAVLQGLAKFAHLISVDFFDDLLNALKTVLENLDHKSSGGTAGAGTRKRLLCIITAFELLSGQGEALSYDLKAYYAELYGILFEAAFHYMVEDKPSVEHLSESEMLTRGLELMFLKKQQVPVNRMAAFVKRFSVVALNMPNKTVMNCLQLVKRLINKDRRLDALIQSEDRAASGVYMPYLQDPDLCNPFGTSLYELFLYKV